REALERHEPTTHQRLSAYGVAVRDDHVLLTRISARGHAPGMWTLPGGGVDHGESPATSLTREFVEETSLAAEVSSLLGVHDVHFTGTAPTGRTEDFHGVHLIFAVAVGDGTPAVTEVDGTTDAAQWVPIADVEAGRLPVFDVVLEGLRLHRSGN
ncbi:MAG: NUDIX domain-containing protein, partial [Myxococcales bacterium]